MASQRIALTPDAYDRGEVVPVRDGGTEWRRAQMSQWTRKGKAESSRVARLPSRRREIIIVNKV
jgi:hypothetical protein